MFRVAFFCEDKNLAPVMYAVAGLVLDLECVPVAGSKPDPIPIGRPSTKPKSVQMAQIAQQGGTPAMFVENMRRRGLTEVKAEQAREICQDIGLAPGSYSHVIGNAVRAGLIKKGPQVGNGYIWKLVEHKKDS